MFRTNIEKDTLNNKKYRKILHTTKELQVVLMSLKPREDIPEEVHHATQFIRIESGNGVAEVSNRRYILKDGVAIVIPSGKKHRIINTGVDELKLYTIYAPPQH
jgi:mannose-6-phosphate isomerase-like protein (cupin superfamily)